MEPRLKEWLWQRRDGSAAPAVGGRWNRRSPRLHDVEFSRLSFET